MIIVSAVRSSEEFLHIDATHKLGFLKNPKVYNYYNLKKLYYNLKIT